MQIVRNQPQQIIRSKRSNILWLTYQNLVWASQQWCLRLVLLNLSITVQNGKIFTCYVRIFDQLLVHYKTTSVILVINWKMNYWNLPIAKVLCYVQNEKIWVVALQNQYIFAKNYLLNWAAGRANIPCKYIIRIFFQFWVWFSRFLFYVISKSSSFLW